MAVCNGPTDLRGGDAHEIDSSQRKETTRCPILNLTWPLLTEDMPEMAIALIPEGGLSRFEAMAQIAESWS